MVDFSAGENEPVFSDLRVNLIVGTHHKTGTVWMHNILRKIGSELNFHFVRYPHSLKNPKKAYSDALKKNKALLRTSPNSGIRGKDLDDATVVHLVRDPRDVLVSAMHYHQKCSEAAVLKKWPGLSGDQTYQECLRDLPTIEDKLMYELNGYTGRVFRGMAKWQFDPSKYFEVRYEDVIEDPSMVVFSEIFDKAGMTEEEKSAALDVVWENSIFGGLSGEKSRKSVHVQGALHIRSGSSGQWRDEFTPAVAKVFSERHQSLLEKYGYETDRSWVSSLH